MDRTTRQIKTTMEEMLRNSGYVAKITINDKGYKAVLAVSMSGQMTLEYPHTLTPGDVVWQIKNIFDTLNRKNTTAEGKQ